jgi:TolB-like protein/AraC-like DNA-binding protein
MSYNKEEEYFSDGITEEIINSLANIDGLHVISRTSSFAFKNLGTDIREIGKLLNVSLILEGSVRRSEGMIRITAQLIKAVDGYHVWSCKWDRELKNILLLQDEIAGIIAGKINSRVNHDLPVRGKKIENTEALDYYLKGTFIQNSWDFKRSKEMVSDYEEAIRLDPLFVKPYIALCKALTWMGATGQINPIDANNKIDQYLTIASGLDNNQADIYAIIAGKKYWIEWNIPEAYNNVEKALELSPSHADVMLQKGLILATLGEIEDCFNCLFQAQKLNPLHSTINYCIALLYRLTNEPEKAIEFLEKNIRIAPEWPAQYILKLEVLCMLKRFDEAWKLIIETEKNPGPGLSIKELKAVFYAFKSEKDKALHFASQLLNETNSNPETMSSNYGYLILIYLLLGESDAAIRLLDKAVEYRSAPLLFIMIDSTWDHLRDQKEYISVTRFFKDTLITDGKIGEEKKYKKTVIPKNIELKLKSKLDEIMNKEKPYLDPTISLSDIAELANCSPNQLSQLLNEKIGKNFYDYVNDYRLRYFQELVKNPKNKQFTFLSLAYESGFNSKTTFNSFFKRSTGLTPSEYLK